MLRASWFSKPATNLPGQGTAYVPYDEEDAAMIETLYQGVLNETVRSLAAGSFLGGGGVGAGGGEKDGLSSSSSCSKGGGGGGDKDLLLKKEVTLKDGGE